MSVRSLLSVATLLGLAAAASAADSAVTTEQAQFFEGKIRPILSEKCYKCHSVEQGKSKGGLTLDTKAGVLKGGKTGLTLKPGSPEDSLLIKAVLYTDSDLQMPPKGEKLTDAQIADLTAWIKMGAPDPRAAKASKLTGLTDNARKHWAFQPVKKPEIPAVKNRAWCVTPVDAFVMEKLEEKGMTPSADLLLSVPGGKDTLLRRATYDLTGLPPTPREMAAFRADTSPQAFATVVDRLLATPQYGERWGRFWLDSARYADTTGEMGNPMGDYRFPYAWTYRDWVIDAFNKDLPYDQFITQQLAADKIPSNPVENLAALGFITVGEKFPNRNDIINDRIDVVSKGFLGLTVACARCHDHMFDPIPTKDYYALHGVFASTLEPTELPVLKEALDPKAKASFQAKVAAVEQKNRDAYFQMLGDYISSFHTKAPAYLHASLTRGNATAEALKANFAYIEENKLDGSLLQEIRQHVRVNNPIFGPYVQCNEAGANLKKVVETIAANPGDKINEKVAAAFKATPPTSMEQVGQLYGKFFASLSGPAQTIIGQYAAARTKDAVVDEKLATVALAPFRVVSARGLDSNGLQKEVDRLPQQLQQRNRFDFARINELTLTDTGAPKKAMAVVDSPTPRDSNVFIRGQAEVKGDLVPRHFLEALSNGQPQPFKNGSGRLELAQAIAAKTNPLTARVMVNRVWMHHFGQGFVRTPDDLGTQSESPSHQELLDYLSWYFMEQGWSFKKLHKLIMLSRVYAESSYANKAHEEIDPENRYLWRANVRRLDFESFRDSLLVMSGQLDKTVGGQPVNLTDEPYSYRRSVYGYIDRGNLPELMQHFDFSNPDMPNSARTSTIVPQQALFLMNSPMAVDVARKIAARPEVTRAGADFTRIQAIYEIVYGRAPRPPKPMVVGMSPEITQALTYITGEFRKQQETTAEMKEISTKAGQNATKRADARAASSSATKAIQNTGEVVERRPLTPWETYTQLLLFSNEAVYIN